MWGMDACAIAAVGVGRPSGTGAAPVPAADPADHVRAYITSLSAAEDSSDDEATGAAYAAVAGRPIALDAPMLLDCNPWFRGSWHFVCLG